MNRTKYIEKAKYIFGNNTKILPALTQIDKDRFNIIVDFIKDYENLDNDRLYALDTLSEFREYMEIQKYSIDSIYEYNLVKDELYDIIDSMEEIKMKIEDIIEDFLFEKFGAE